MTQRNTIKMPAQRARGIVRKFQVINPDGSLAVDLEAFPNHILDQGLDEIANSRWSEVIENCVVGTGNSTPTDAQTELDNEIARTNNYLTGFPNCMTYLSDAGATPATFTHRRTYDFPAGTLDSSTDGDYQEIGFSLSGSAGQNLFSRTLIKDGNGDPIAVTVDSDQILRIQYDLEIALSPAVAGDPPTPVADSFDITNIGTINGDHLIQFIHPNSLLGPTDIMISNAQGFRYVSNNPALTPLSVVKTSDGAESEYNSNAKGGWCLEPFFIPDLNDFWIFDAPVSFSPVLSENGPLVSGEKVTLSEQSYSAGSFSKIKTATLETGDANKEINCIGLAFSDPDFPDEGVPVYAFVIDSADRFTKANTHTLTINLQFSWGRA